MKSIVPPVFFQSKGSLQIVRTSGGLVRIGVHFYDSRIHGLHALRNVSTTTRGFSYAIQGSATYIDWNGERHQIYPGTFFHCYADPGRPISLICDNAWAECSVSINHGMYQRMVALGLVRPRVLVYPIGLVSRIAEGYMNIYREIKREDAELSSRPLTNLIELLQTVYEMGDACSDDENPIQKACRILERDCISRETIEKVAQEVGMQYEAFRRRFRQVMGVSPGDYRIRKRIDRAYSMLMDKPIKEIAATLGYSDRYAFTRQFKSVSGCTPTEFRNEIWNDKRAGVMSSESD